MFIEYLLSAKAALTKKRAAEDEMVRKHHLLNEHEFEQTLGDSGGQKGLVCCSPWHCQESVTTTATICIAAYGRGRKVIHLQVLLESHLQLPPAAVSVSLQDL